MLSGNQSIFQSLSIVSIIGALTFTSTYLLAQDAPQTLPDHTNGALTQQAPVTTPNVPQDGEIRTPIMETSYEFRLRRGNVLSMLTPDLSADEVVNKLVPATEVESNNVEGFQHIVATLSLRKENPQKVMFARSSETSAYDTLIVDRNLDGSFADEAAIIIDKEALVDDITQTQSRDGKHMVEFKTALMTDNVHPEVLPKFGDYPAILRIKWDNLNNTPKEVIWFGYYFYQTEIPVADKTYQILLHDINNDGQITDLDHWMLKDKQLEITDNVSRKISDYNWINGIAWKIEVLSQIGDKAYIHRYNPKITYEQDTANRDQWSEDKNAVRSEWKDRLNVLTDHDTALKTSSEKQKHLIIKFESTWCEACSAINNFVLPQQGVVDASSDYIWARFNNEENADLTSLYNISSYPTFIILHPSGKEVKRFNSVNGDTLTEHLNNSLLIEVPKEPTAEIEPDTLASHSDPPLTEENSDDNNNDATPEVP